jgi:hypothetical protein
MQYSTLGRPPVCCPHNRPSDHPFLSSAGFTQLIIAGDRRSREWWLDTVDMESCLLLLIFVGASLLIWFDPFFGGCDLFLSALLPLSQLSVLYGLTHCDQRSATYRVLCRCALPTQPCLSFPAFLRGADGRHPTGREDGLTQPADASRTNLATASASDFEMEAFQTLFYTDAARGDVQWCCSGPATWLGRVSYSLFLVHEPVAMYINAFRVGPSPFPHCHCLHDMSADCQSRCDVFINNRELVTWCVDVSRSVSPSPCPSPCLPHRVPHRASLTVSLTVSPSPSLSLCLPHRLSRCVSLTVSLTAPPSPSLPPCLPHRLSH